MYPRLSCWYILDISGYPVDISLIHLVILLIHPTYILLSCWYILDISCYPVDMSLIYPVILLMYPVILLIYMIYPQYTQLADMHLIYLIYSADISFSLIYSTDLWNLFIRAECLIYTRYILDTSGIRPYHRIPFIQVISNRWLTVYCEAFFVNSSPASSSTFWRWLDGFTKMKSLPTYTAAILHSELARIFILQRQNTNSQHVIANMFHF